MKEKKYLGCFTLPKGQESCAKLQFHSTFSLQMRLSLKEYFFIFLEWYSASPCILVLTHCGLVINAMEQEARFIKKNPVKKTRRHNQLRRFDNRCCACSSAYHQVVGLEKSNIGIFMLWNNCKFVMVVKMEVVTTFIAKDHMLCSSNV